MSRNTTVGKHSDDDDSSSSLTASEDSSESKGNGSSGKIEGYFGESRKGIRKTKPKKAKVKASRRSFTLAFKIQSVKDFNKEKQLKKNLKASTFAESIGVSKTTFHEWRSDHSQLLLAGACDDRFKNRAGTFPEVENEIVKYLNKRAALFKQDKLGLNYDVIRMKALELAEEIAKQDGMDHYKTFEASNHWIRNVITRNSFVNIKAHGEAGDIDEKETAAAMQRVQLL